MLELVLRGNFFDLKETYNISVDDTLKATAHREWVQYNPQKAIKRYGLALTSLDGSESKEYEINGLTSLKELYPTGSLNRDLEGPFNKITPLARELKLDVWFEKLLGKDFEQYIGRSHLIKLDAGGFFPPHRDGNLLLSYEEDHFRLFTPILNCDKHELVWLHQGSQLNFRAGSTYFINTYQEHAVYSFVDGCVFAVFNIKNSAADKVLRQIRIH